jgi:hypothetical protein
MIGYKATINRILRGAISSFLESVGVVLATTKELDVDVYSEAFTRSLEGVPGFVNGWRSRIWFAVTGGASMACNDHEGHHKQLREA